MYTSTDINVHLQFDTLVTRDESSKNIRGSPSFYKLNENTDIEEYVSNSYMYFKAKYKSYRLMPVHNAIIRSVQFIFCFGYKLERHSS